MNEETKQPAAIIKRQRVVLEGLEPPSLVRSNPAQACGKKSARLVEHEGRARAIEFTCSCGETTLVELLFEEKAGVKS